MQTINTVFLCLALTILLCTCNVFTYCGNDEQIDDLQTALIIHETSYTIMTTLSAIPITGTGLVLAQIMSSAQYGVRLKGIFDEMQNSLNKDHFYYQKCSAVMEKSQTATAIIKGTSTGLSIATLIPGFGMVLVAPRVATSISAILVVRDCLKSWQNNKCQYATTRDCDL